jgi:hypothetical protein
VEVFLESIKKQKYKGDRYIVLVQQLIDTIVNTGAAWNRNPRIGIGDMSLQNGGNFSQHDSHQRGVDVDVRYVRNDGNEDRIDFNEQDIDNDPQGNFPGAEDADLNGNGIFDSVYDQASTQLFIDLLIQNGASVIFADPRARLVGNGVIQDPAHFNHIHVRIPDPYQ